MDSDSLTDEKLRALDYVLNYTPNERIVYTIDDNVINNLIQFIDREEKIDDYSNTYEILSLNEDYQADIKGTIEEKFAELYTDDVGRYLDKTFEERPLDAFQFYNDVTDEFDEPEVDDKSIQPYAGDYNDLTGLLQDLEKGGLGFRRRYMTTTDNYYLQFEFRHFPLDGLVLFIERGRAILREHLGDFSPAEMWAAYVNAYLGEPYIFDNIDSYSRKQIEEAVDNPRVIAKESLTFLNEDIKDLVQDRLQHAIRRDTYYLSTIEFLKVAASHNEPEGYYSFDTCVFDAISGNQTDELKSYIGQLHSEGILLKKDEQYIITEEVLAVLDEIEERSKIESYPIESFKDAQNILYRIFAQTEEEIKIIDRFFTMEALRLIDSNSPNNVRIFILYSERVKEDDLDRLREELSSPIFDDSNYEVRKMQPLPEEGVPHDRFIIIDNQKVWQVGHSLNGLGKDFSTVFSHSEKESPRYVRLFDDLWQEGEKLQYPDST